MVALGSPPLAMSKEAGTAEVPPAVDALWMEREIS